MKIVHLQSKQYFPRDPNQETLSQCSLCLQRVTHFILLPLTLLSVTLVLCPVTVAKMRQERGSLEGPGQQRALCPSSVGWGRCRAVSKRSPWEGGSRAALGSWGGVSLALLPGLPTPPAPRHCFCFHSRDIHTEGWGNCFHGATQKGGRKMFRWNSKDKLHGLCF